VIAYLSRRLIGLVPLLLGITLISFMVIHVAPGSPMDLLTDMNPDASPELRDRLGEIAISTIDAFCLSLLREFPLEADLDIQQLP